MNGSFRHWAFIPTIKHRVRGGLDTLSRNIATDRDKGPVPKAPIHCFPWRYKILFSNIMRVRLSLLTYLIVTMSLRPVLKALQQ